MKDDGKIEGKGGEKERTGGEGFSEKWGMEREQERSEKGGGEEKEDRGRSE